MAIGRQATGGPDRAVVDAPRVQPAIWLDRPGSIAAPPLWRTALRQAVALVGLSALATAARGRGGAAPWSVAVAFVRGYTHAHRMSVLPGGALLGSAGRTTLFSPVPRTRRRCEATR